MKRILSILILLMSAITVISISSCSKEDSTYKPPPPPPPTTTITMTPMTTTQPGLYVTADNWVKVSEGNYKCTFYGLMGYGTELPGIVRVYLIDQNGEKIISSGSLHFMDGELSASHDKFSVWVSFQAPVEKQTLPFSALKLRISFK